MTTAPTTSWPATTGRRWRRSFSTSPAAAFSKSRREPGSHASGHRAAPDRRHDSALLVPVAVIVAAALGTDLLAGVADRHLGVSAALHRAECRVLRPRRRHADRR